MKNEFIFTLQKIKHFRKIKLMIQFSALDEADYDQFELEATLENNKNRDKIDKICHLFHITWN